MCGFFTCSSGKHVLPTEEGAKRCCNGWVKVKIPIRPGASTIGTSFVGLVTEEEVLRGVPEKDLEATLLLINLCECRYHH